MSCLNHRAGRYAVMILAALPNLWAQPLTVTAHVTIVNTTAQQKASQQSNVVIWLAPIDRAVEPPMRDVPQQQLVLSQKNKSFDPHLLVVQMGAVVDFPNRDPFFHNVFSLFEGKRFDLGLYEAGTTRHVRFDRPGICYIFCNIHAEMSAVVVVLDTPYYGMANRAGAVAIANVPAGRYLVHVWDERSLPETLGKLTREVGVSETRTFLGTFRIQETETPVAHKNKYGRDYDKPVPSSPIYVQP